MSSRPPLPAKALSFAVLTALAPAAQAAVHNWSNGSFVAGATAPHPMLAGDVLNILTGGNKSFISTTWTQQGTVNWTDNTLFGGSATVNNEGLWDSQSDSNTFNFNVGGQPSFVNTGEFRKSTGIQTNMGNWQFTNDGGAINAQTGVINFNTASNTFNNGGIFKGAGVVRVSGGASFNGDFVSDNLEIAGGTNSGSNARLMGGAAGAGAVTWSGGSLTGSWELSSGTTLIGADGTTKQLVNHDVTNNGTILWQSTADLHGGSGTLTNNGLFEAQANARLNHNIGGQPIFVNSASGTLRAADGISFTNLDFNFVNNGGVLDAWSGGQLVFEGNANSFNDGTQFIGAGRIRVASNATFSGNYTSANLELESGTASGNNANKAIAHGTTKWTGGSINGTWELASGHTLVGADGAAKQLVNHDVTNNGTILWQSTADLQGGGGTLTNNGLFEVQANAGLNHNTGGQPIFVNSATGTLRAVEGISFTNLDFNFVNNGGVLDARSGGQLVFEGNANSFNDGTQFIGAGRIRVASNATFSGNYTSANLELESGTARGNNANKAIAHGTTKWTGGSINGTWELASGHTLVGADGAAKQLVNHNVTNNGTILWQTTNNITGGGGTLINNGLFEFQTNADMTHTSGGQPAFANNGMVRKSAGAGETSLASISFSNNGVVDVQSGSIRLPNGFTNNGILMGVGSFATNTLTNAGHVAPGASPGSLSIDANFAQTSVGVLDIELGNLASFDQLLVDGTATLDGFLALSCFGDCGFVVGDEITILDSTGNLTGEFSAGVTLTGFNTGAFDVIYDYSADEVRLLVTQDVTAVPEPEAWAMLLAGLGLVGVAVRRRRC